MGDHLRIFILPDQHYAPEGDVNGGVDPQAEAVALRAAKLIKPDMFVNLGDAGEWTSVSAWEWAKRRRPPLEFQMPLIDADAKAVNAGLDKWDDVLPKNCKKIFLCGNHDAWLNKFVAENPYLPQYLPERLLRLEERGYDYHPYGEYVEIVPELWAYHGGHYKTPSAHLCNLHGSVMYGHVHDAESATSGGLRGTISAWTMGCICKLDKPFLKGKPTNWKHGFGLVTVLDSGEYQVEFIPITGGVSNCWGKKLVA